MKVNSRRAPRRALEPKRLTNGYVSAVCRCETFEMAVEICPATGVKNPVRAETAGPPGWVYASNRPALITMKDPVSHRDDHCCGRADEVDSGVGMLPRGVAKALTDIHGRAVHGGPDNRVGLCGARNRRVVQA